MISPRQISLTADCPRAHSSAVSEYVAKGGSPTVEAHILGMTRATDDYVERAVLDQEAAQFRVKINKLETEIEELRKQLNWAQGEIDRLLNEPQTAGVWQPIETAPKDGLSILLGWPGDTASEGLWRDGSQNHWKLAGFYFSDDDPLTAKPCKPTLWMHLPACPPVTRPQSRSGE